MNRKKKPSKEPQKAPKRRFSVRILTVIALILAIIAVGICVVYAEDLFSLNTKDGTWVQDANDENVYYMDQDGNGEYDITLTKNGNVWTYSFSVPDEKAKYYVLEEINRQGNYDLVDENGNKIAYAVIEEGTGEVTMYNVAEGYGVPEFGGLKLTKAVQNFDGAALTAENNSTMFRFDITLSYTGTKKNTVVFLSGTQTYGDLSFTWSEENDSYTASASVYLKAGESIELTGIPAEVTYSVSEAHAEGYTPAWSGETSGVIKSKTTAELLCTNTSDKPDEPEKTGSIRVKKTVLNADGTAVSEDDNEFQFLTVFFGLKEKTEYTFSVYDANSEKEADKSFTTLFDGSAEVEFTLKNGQYAVFSDLTAECRYQVLEYGAEGYTASYEIEDAVFVTSSRGENFSDNSNLSTQKETLDKEEAEAETPVTVHFTNTLPPTLPDDEFTGATVSKVWSDGNENHISEQVTVYLIQSTSLEELEYGDVVGMVLLSADNDWTWTWSDLSLYRDNGELYYYTVREESVDGYVSAVEVRNRDQEDNELDYTKDYIFTVTNTPGEEMPLTGGIGTTIFYVAGLGLIIVSVALLVGRRKKIFANKKANKDHNQE